MSPTRAASLKGIGTLQAWRRRQRDAQREADHAERVASEDAAAVLARRDRYRSTPVEAPAREDVAVPVHGRDAAAWLFGGGT